MSSWYQSVLQSTQSYTECLTGHSGWNITGCALVAAVFPWTFGASKENNKKTTSPKEPILPLDLPPQSKVAILRKLGLLSPNCDTVLLLLNHADNVEERH